MTCALIFAVVVVIGIAIVCAVVQSRRLRAAEDFVEALKRKDRP